MPYDRIVELPEFIQNKLPVPAQLIYKEAFNNAWSHFEDLDEWSVDANLRVPVDELAHHVAWNTVNRVYEKRDRKWIHK